MARYPRLEIPAGTVFAELTIVEEVERSGKVRQHRRFLCRCSCGNEKVAYLTNLRAGRTWSCGCTYEPGERGREVRKANYQARAQPTTEGRICLTCDTWKSWDAFGIDRRDNRGRASSCFECNNWRTVKSYFGITKEEFYAQQDVQGGVCALCGEPEVDRRLSIDHDHSCCGPNRGCKECIRGLLCGNCNRMLGFVEKRAALHSRFSDYLSQRPFASVPAGGADAVAKLMPDDPEGLQ